MTWMPTGQKQARTPQILLHGAQGVLRCSPFPQDPKVQSDIYLQCWALAGTRSTPWLAILLKMPSGNPGFSWAPSKAGTLCFFLTTGTTLKRIFLQPLDTSRDRCSCSSFRLAAFSEPATTCHQSSSPLLGPGLPTCRHDCPSLYLLLLYLPVHTELLHNQPSPRHSILHNNSFPRDASLCWAPPSVLWPQSAAHTSQTCGICPLSVPPPRMLSSIQCPVLRRSTGHGWC